MKTPAGVRRFRVVNYPRGRVTYVSHILNLQQQNKTKITDWTKTVEGKWRIESPSLEALHLILDCLTFSHLRLHFEIRPHNILHPLVVFSLIFLPSNYRVNTGQRGKCRGIVFHRHFSIFFPFFKQQKWRLRELLAPVEANQVVPVVLIQHLAIGLLRGSIGPLFKARLNPKEYCNSL